MNKVCRWLQCNSLAVNGKKSQFMLLKCAKPDAPNFSITIGDTVVKPANVIITLGFTIDCKLTFNRHIKGAKGKARKGLYALKLAAKFVDRKTAVMMANGLVFSHLNYGDLTLGQAAPTTLDRLQSTQDRAVRIICGAHPLADTAPLRHRLGWVDVHQKHAIHLATFVWNCLHQEAPVIMQSWFQLNDPSSYDTRHFEPMYKPTYSKVRGMLSMSYRGPDLWNELPVNVHQSKTALACREATYAHFYEKNAAKFE